jgi:hypothetical protein
MQTESFLLVSALQSFIRANGYAWPGGYQMALLMSDGESIDAQAARENYRLIRDAMRANDTRSNWHPCTPFIHWEGEALTCAHSGRAIPSVYGEIDAAA